MSLGKRISILSPHFNLLAPLLAAILLAINYLPGLCGAGQYMTAEWIRRGVFPLWNPTACFGMPQLAYAILSPLSPTVLLYVAMPFQVAAIAEIILLSALAAWGWALLGGRFGLSAPARIVIALLAAADNTSGAALTSSLWAMALLPFLFLFTEDLAENASLKNAARWAACFGFLWIWGVSSYLAYRFSLALILYLLLRAIELRTWKPVGAGILAFIAGLLLASIQLIPFYEFLRTTSRIDPATSWGSDGSVGLLGFLCAVIPGMTGTITQQNVWSFTPVFTGLPIPVLALMPLGLVMLRRGGRAMAILMVTSAFLAAGHHLPLHPSFIDYVPGYALVRNHATWGIIFELVCLILAGAVLSPVEDFTDRSRKYLRGFYALACFAAILLLLAGTATLALDAARFNWVSRVRDALESMPGHVSRRDLDLHHAAVGPVISKALLGASLYWLFCLALIIAWLRSPAESRAYRFFFMSMLVMTLCSTLLRPAVNFYTDAPLASVEASIGKWDVARAERRIWSEQYLWSFTSSLSTRVPFQLPADMKAMGMIELPDETEDRAIILDELLRNVPPNTGMLFGAHYTNGLYGIIPRRVLEYLSATPGAQGAYTLGKPAIPWAAIPGLAILVSPDTSPPQGFHMRESGTRMNVFEVDAVRPRVERFTSWITFADSATLLADLASTASDTSRVRVIRNAAASQVPNSLAMGFLRIVSENPNRVIMETDGTESALVVLRDAFAPGWQAIVDGSPARAEPVDHAFRGAFVPPGFHEVEFRYDPAGIRIAAPISAIVAVFVIASLCYGWRRSA